MDATLLTRHRGDYLWGSFYQGTADGVVETKDPSTGIVLDEVPYRRAAVDEAVADARRAADDWGRCLLEQRLRIAATLAELIGQRQDALASLVARELGKPLWEARMECVAASRAVDLLIEQAREVLNAAPHPQVPGTLRRRPMGVVGCLTPFPYPIYGPIQTVLPCLLAGNTVVWNPSSRVPLISQRLADAFDAARVPPGVLSMVQGPRSPIGKALVEHEGLDMVVAVGSAELADTVQDATDGIRRSWVQGGGKGWAIVCADADLDRAAYEVVTGAFLSTGQRCNATSRVLVEASVAREFLKRVVALSNGLQVAPPTDPDAFCGPLVDQAARRRFHATVKAYAEAGVDFALEGGAGQLPSRLRRRGQCYVAPAVGLLEGDLPAGLTPPEEIEGPLLIASLVGEAEEAVRLYNAHPYGLAAAIFTADRRRFETLAGELRAGAVNWNRGTIVASARFPNAGMKRSGLGAEGNGALLRASTWPQSTLMGAGRFDPSHRVPGMAWPEEMGPIETTELNTPPFRPDSDVFDPTRVPTEAMSAVKRPRGDEDTVETTPVFEE